MYLFSRFSYNRTKRLSRNALKNVDNIITREYRDGVERRGKCPRLPTRTLFGAFCIRHQERR